MRHLFTSESVSEGHPDKMADQISDALLDNYLAFDKNSKVACETLVTTGQVVVAGEIKTNSIIDHDKIIRNVINDIGYNKSEYQFDAQSCGIFSALHSQSSDINQGVDRSDEKMQGAGDQGMMFGYASNETEDYMPISIDLSHKLLIELADVRRENDEIRYLRPDSKSQVTLEYKDGKPNRIDSIVISTQHDEFDNDDTMLKKIKSDMINLFIPRFLNNNPQYKNLFNDNINYHINPTGKLVIGGPHGDTGLTGRKIIVDTYGGKGAHGGGAFSGKDPSKVDRSAAYATRHIAKNICAAGICDEILVQVSYAIGVAKPMGIYVNTFGSSKCNMNDIEISNVISENIGMTPYDIENRLKLRNPMYLDTASYGHMGRKPSVIKKDFASLDGNKKSFDVETFTWEKLDMIDKIKELIK